MRDEPFLTFGEGESIGKGATVYPAKLPVAPFQLTTFDVSPGYTTPVDKHQVKEVWVVQEGCGELTYEGNKWLINAGFVLYFNSFTSHQVKNVGKDILRILSIYW